MSGGGREEIENEKGKSRRKKVQTRLKTMQCRK